MGKIDISSISACGECCIGCKKKTDGACEGCIETDGRCIEWAHTGRCPAHACAKEHNVQFCGLCSDFPCDELTAKIHWNTNIVEHLSQLAKQFR